MMSPCVDSRIDLAELKAQLVKRIGPERSKNYFYCLNRFLSMRISKAEFDRLSVKFLGRKNVSLHNQLIRGILRNACYGKVPPPPPTRRTGVSTRFCGPLPPPNGEILLLKSQEMRKMVAVGPNGGINVSSQSHILSDSFMLLKDECLKSNNSQKLVQHHQELRTVVAEEMNGPSLVGSNNVLISRKSNSPNTEVAEVETRNSLYDKVDIQVPAGIRFCHLNSSGFTKSFPLAGSSRFSSSHDKGELLDTQSLWNSMQQIAAAQGLEGVSMECANLLNFGLDAYLKGLIKSCIELVGTSCRSKPVKNITQNSQSRRKVVNGILPKHQGELHTMRPLSMLDFKVAMEVKPQQLGEDWVLLLEKICTHESAN